MPHNSIRRIAAGALVALAALFLVPTAPASAKAAENWGFAYNDNPAPIGEYVMPINRQWGSWKTFYPSDWATVAHLGPGYYRVTFPHIGGKGLAHVTAVNYGPTSCQIVATTAGFEVEFVYVRCYKPGGTLADSAFSVAYTENRTSDGQYGWVAGKADATIINSYNSSGGTNAVGGSGTGNYKVWLPGLGGTAEAGNIQVTAVNPAKLVRCKPTYWLPGSGGQLFVITCYDQTGATTKSDWNLSYHHKANLFGASDPPKYWGYVWDSPSGTPATNVNSVGSVNTVVTAGTGLRMVTFNKVGYEQSHVQVTAYGNNANYCNLLAPWLISGGAAIVRDVACYDSAGVPTNTDSFVSYTSRL